MAKKKKLSKAGKIILDVILAVSLCAAGYSGYRLWKETEKYRVAGKSYDDLRDTVMIKPSETDDGTAEKSIDWEALKALNPAFFAWIELPGSTIDYPVIQGTDNEYYLKHLPDGTYNDAGTVFIDMNNQTDFSDRVTVFYGHHMLDDPLMFAEVENYKNQSYYDSHPEFLIHTPDAEYKMYPAAGYVTTGTAGYVQTEFSSDEEFMAYIESFMAQSDFVSETVIEKEDHVLMLSTCSYDVYDGRYVLIGKLVKVSG